MFGARHRRSVSRSVWLAAVVTAALTALATSASAGAVRLARAGQGSSGTVLRTVRAHASSPRCPWVNRNQSIAKRVSELMRQMTVDQEDFIVEGHGMTHESPNPSPNPYVFWMPGIPQLCIPPLGEEDGPAGVADQLTGVTQLPTGVGLAATFDPSLARRYGQVIGQEELGKGAAVNLGPTVNIDRDPRWGRSFEAFTEDPFLNAALATGEIEGVQSTGEMSQVKHFDAYNQETYRFTPQDDAIVSNRTLHEVYMPAFEAAAKQAEAASVMCAYSTVNGKFSCQNPYLLTDVLKQEWDFPGFVTSDYAALHDTTGGAFAGDDQEQPFNAFFGAPLEAAVNTGAIPRAVINTMVERIFTEMFRFGLFDHPLTPTPTATVTTPAHQGVGTEVADAGTTLLKNDRHTLPLSADHAGTVAVIGPSASTSPTDSGGGSTYVVPSRTVTPLQGLVAAAGSGTHLVYGAGLPADSSLPAIPASALTPAYSGTGVGDSYAGMLTAPETGTYVLALKNPCACYASTYLYLNGQELLDNPGAPPVSVYSVAVNLTAGQTYSVKIAGASSNFDWGTPSALAPGIAAAADAAKSASAAVVVVSDDTESEGTDRPSLDLPSAQNELISAVAATNRHTVVVIDAGAPVSMPWLNHVGAVLDAWYPGQSNGTSLARVVFGQVDPSGHLPATFPASLSQVPASAPAQFPGTNGRVRYSEGLDVGYRWYDAKHLTPLIPFGFGLSYTRFAFNKLRVSPGGVDGVHDVKVSATITNVGVRAGADVAQLYLGDPAAAAEPPRQLVGFQRVALAAGQSARLHFTITPRDTWWWDDGAAGWSQSAGLYRVYVGDSSALANLPLRDAFRMFTTPAARQVKIRAPSTIQPGRPTTVRVILTAAGNESLRNVRLALELPQGWTARRVSPSSFRFVRPMRAPTVTFRVMPPSYAPAANEVVHATAGLGPDAQREAGVTVTVG